jgi:drug/metabolite transporter (DMT)-like permease
MFGGFAILLVPALLDLPDRAPTAGAVASLAALAVLGTALAQIILFAIIARYGARRLSLVTYLMPGFAVLYGWLLLDERVGAASLGGLALILGGVALGSGAIRWRRREVPA